MPDDKNNTAASISLPKGGGAVKGIGETFQPNLFTGTGNFSVPITTSPGRNGFGPKLTLQYSTGNGNGPFGLGWQLSTPRITRKTEKGLPTYTDEDVFIMSGVEDLVIVDSQLVDSDQPTGFTVTRFRPRTEGLFARIEKWINNNDANDIHWRATTKENVTSIYGKSTSARITHPYDSRKIFEWLLEETFDAKGNHILYEYIQENTDLKLHGIHEQNRRYTQTYIRRILYGNTPDSLPDERKAGPIRQNGTNHTSNNAIDTKPRHYVFEVLFDYHDLPDEIVPGFDWRALDYKVIPDTWPDRTFRDDRFSSYRSSFEIRTLRCTKRVLMLHHFKEDVFDGAIPEINDAPLVKSTNFEYHTNKDVKLSVLDGANVFGYRKDSQNSAKYLYRDMPPVTFKYSEFKPQEQCYQSVSAKGNDFPPLALNNPNFTLIDLFGDGLPDILNTTDKGYYFWQNLGSGKIDRRHPQHTVPAGVTLSNSGVAVGDMGGDGLPDLIVEAPPMSGFYEARQDGDWKAFKRFDNMPSIGLSDPNSRLVDLTGDGLSDVLVTRDRHFLWFQCKGEEGYAASKAVARKHDLNEFPDVYFNDTSKRVRLADMTGDGLNDIVQLHDGLIEYWPNLGYANFGKRITMTNAPRQEYNFDPKRLFLVDIDGTGCADIVYVGFNSVHFWFNQSGNGWSDKQTINGTPRVADTSAVQFADFFGTGTATLVWSYDYNLQPGGNYKVLDFCGGLKPHLITEMSNNMGATTRAQYASSVKFYLEDKEQGTPWVTNLPFPVQVLEKTEVIDHISKTKLVTTYKYHHGYYDGREREFRGFGRVDQYDTEVFDDFAGSNLHGDGVTVENNKKEYHVPPVLTKSWFHTGIYFDENMLAANGVFYDKEDMMTAYRKEFYQNDVQSFDMEDHDVEVGEASHEAYRALRGSLLRSEVYAQDDTEKTYHPYTVTDNRYRVKQLQQKGGNNHAVFMPLQKESVSYHYERNPDDPRIGHEITLKMDEYGNVTDKMAIGYPRKNPVYDEQDELKMLYTKDDFINKPDETGYYYIGVACQSRAYEVTGIDWDWSMPTLTSNEFEEVISYPDDFWEYNWSRPMGHTGVEKRIVEWTRQYYRQDQDPGHIDSPENLTHRLDFGIVESLALPYETYQAAFTEDFIDSLLPVNINDNDFQTEGGYHNGENDKPEYWWIPSGRQSFNVNKFFSPENTQDPFGNQAVAFIDDYALLMKSATDAVGNIIVAENDYRVLQPYKIKDPNDNDSQVAFDTLGMVVGTAIMGEDKDGNSVGDSLIGFDPDLDPLQISNHIDDPLNNHRNILQNATTRLVYDLKRYDNDIIANRTPRPNVVYTLARETHVHIEHSTGEDSNIQHSFVYSDGFGREVQTKIQAEPGPVYDTDGNIAANNADPRWVGTGTIVYNNKGKPVQQYEPFFSINHFYGIEQHGVSPTIFYDPLERVICTLHPNHTYEKVFFDPWRQKTWDANDTIRLNLLSDNDVKGYVADYFQQKYGTSPPQTWYEERINGSDVAEKEAAQKTEPHADTPTIAHLDTLGRTFLTIQDNGPRNEDKYHTHVTLDIEGNDKIIKDPRKIDAFEHTFDMAGRKLKVDSKDAGVRLNLPDITGENPWYVWDDNDNDNEIKTEYDELRRPVRIWVKKDGVTRLVNHTQYGDEAGIVDAQRHHLRGQVYRVYDDAGEVINPDYDFKGNILTVQRRLLQDYKLQVDWNSATFPAFETDSVGDPVSYSAENEYDALNRITESIAPDGSVHKPIYNKANFLETVKVRLSGETDDRGIVTNIDYNSKGQREKIEYGNNICTKYTYDPDTYRLQSIVTKKSNGDIIQDLRYIYDPVGNITQIHDDAFQTVFNHNQRVDPINKYKYDPIYRLIEATGREHGSMTACHYQTNDKKHTEFIPLSSQPINNGQDIYNYTQFYQYDSSGNFTQTKHVGKNNWTRDQEYSDTSNRLKTSKAGCPNESAFNYIEETDANGNIIKNTDDNGNILKMPHLNEMKWDYSNRLVEVETNIKTNGTNDRAYYQYDAGGQRVRKVIEQGNSRVEERVYLGGYEIYRIYNGTGTTFERSTLHVMDDKKRIALIETKTKDNNDPGSVPDVRVRYQLDNHLGSPMLEVDENANEISYEEYYPYGGTAYMAGKNKAEVKLKRYRYSGKERDDETGLYYYGARYYVPWLGRWLSCDPAGIVDGTNVYGFSKYNPNKFVDRNGLKSEENENEPQYHQDFVSDLREADAADMFGWDELASKQRKIAFDEAMKGVQVHIVATKTGEELLAAFKILNDIWLVAESDAEVEKALISVAVKADLFAIKDKEGVKLSERMGRGENVRKQIRLDKLIETQEKVTEKMKSEVEAMESAVQELRDTIAEFDLEIERVASKIQSGRDQFKKITGYDMWDGAGGRSILVSPEDKIQSEKLYKQDLALSQEKGRLLGVKSGASQAIREGENELASTKTIMKDAEKRMVTQHQEKSRLESSGGKN